MPTIRNGRGELSVHDMSPAAATAGPPPVERRQGPVAPAPDSPSLEIDPAGKTVGEVRRARLERDAAFMAASRARGAAAGGFVKGATKPGRDWAATVAARSATVRATLSPRQAAVIAALRRLGDRGAVAKEFGVAYQTVDAVLSAAASKGLLPADVPDLPRRLRTVVGPPTKTIESQGREAGAPATDADEHGTTGAAPAAQVATPLGSIAPEPPDPPQPPPAVLLPCEGCIHAIVCSIKPELEAWAKTLLAPVSPLAAISIGAISVSCVYERAEP